MGQFIIIIRPLRQALGFFLDKQLQPSANTFLLFEKGEDEMNENKIGENKSSGAEKVENVINEKTNYQSNNMPYDRGRVAFNAPSSKENAVADSRSKSSPKQL